MSDEPLVLLGRHGAIAEIKLNRPRKMNALSDELVEQLIDAFTAADVDDNVRVIVLAAAGANFGAGFDLKESSYAKTDQPLSHYHWMIRNMRNTYQTLWNTRKPTIAKVHGYCIAGHCYLQMLCDITVAAEDAMLGHPAVASGGLSAMPLWAWYLGTRKAKEMLLTGKIIDGIEAARIGLINTAVPGPELDKTVDTLAQQMAALPMDAAALCKEQINTAADIGGLAAMFRSQGHLSALARYGKIDLDLDELHRKNAEKVQVAKSGKMVSGN